MWGSKAEGSGNRSKTFARQPLGRARVLIRAWAWFSWLGGAYIELKIPDGYESGKSGRLGVGSCVAGGCFLGLVIRWGGRDNRFVMFVVLFDPLQGSYYGY